MGKTGKKQSPKGLIWIAPLVFLAVLAFMVVRFGVWDIESGVSVPFQADAESGKTQQGGQPVLQSPVLEKTVRADGDYFAQTYFLGDSNTERFYLMGFVKFDHMYGKTGIGVKEVPYLAFIRFEGDSSYYTMPQALKKSNARRAVLTFGTNDVGHFSAEEFIENYVVLIEAIREENPYCDIIINSIPPFAKSNSYPKMSLDIVREFNRALEEMCEKEGLVFLNSYEELSGNDGFAKDGFTDNDGLHLTDYAIDSLIGYFNTHMYQTEDRRPDVSEGMKRTA